MNDQDLESFERELEALKPAPPPREFVDRLAHAITIEADRNSHSRKPAPSPEPSSLWLHRPQAWLRWLLPATVAVLASILVWRSDFAGRRDATAGAELKADEVKIGSTLVSSFDAVASTPDGEPVRFRCEEWLDEVRLSDRSRGLVYSQQVPRVTVVPVSFETY